MRVYEKELRSRPRSRFEIALKPEITDTGTDNTRFEKKNSRVENFPFENT